MIRNYFIIILFISSSPVFAHEIQCWLDYHVFAYYNDGTGLAIERQNDKFSINYEKDKINTNETAFANRQIGALAGSIYDSHDEFGGGDYIEGVHVAILDPDTGYIQSAVAPLTSQQISLTSSQREQPGVLPNEVRRDLFWTITCRWKQSAIQDDGEF